MNVNQPLQKEELNPTRKRELLDYFTRIEPSVNNLNGIAISNFLENFAPEDFLIFLEPEVMKLQKIMYVVDTELTHCSVERLMELHIFFESFLESPHKPIMLYSSLVRYLAYLLGVHNRAEIYGKVSAFMSLETFDSSYRAILNEVHLKTQVQ